ncbi:MAG: 2-succinyl-5-enolpyruvyl-6-hydroxy-3-cyclohexene-1-carboxylic-acid synthase [Armatimonadota bacterium]
MRPEDATYAYIGALIDEVARAGIAHLCLCPGSRSTPLALCAARHPGIRTWTLIDERSASFFALGLAKGSRAPVAVLSTSGTAAANFLPAVVEARYGRVPLVVLTADRPHELRDVGANQTIDQIHLFGTHAKWFTDLALPEATEAALRYVRSIACQAVAAARALPAGPVHLNVPLREPLVPAARASGDRGEPPWDARAAGRPYTASASGLLAPDPEATAALAGDMSRLERGLIVCGPDDDPALPRAAGRLAAATGYPILADPLSQVRCGPHDRTLVVDSYDAFLRLDTLADALVPDIVIRTGGLPASRPLQQYLQRHASSRHVVFDSDGGWNDPMRLASDLIHTDARLMCESLADGLYARRAPERPANSPWPAVWLRLGAEARQAIRRRLDVLDEPFEGKVFSELSVLLPDGATLYVGNSMPVRDLETFFPGVPGAIRILGNRGASGIDGLVSSALGAAAAGDGPLVLVLGDLALYHDLNGLLAAKLHGLRATIVLLNNDGGGIFSFMPQAGVPEHFEALFGTPTGLEFRFAAQLYGAGFVRADEWDVFRTSLRDGVASKGLEIIEVRTDRDRNVVLHRQVWAAVKDALSVDDVVRALRLPVR